MSASKHTKPAASRPSMPSEYGILGPTKGGGLLAWSWAVERLSKSRGQWLATTRPDDGPHMMVVWGVWLVDGFYFCTSPRSRKGRNLAINPRCVVCTDRTDEAVIVEGMAEQVRDAGLIKRFTDAYRKKYKDDVDTSQFLLYVVRPAVSFGFISNPEQWAGSATRWRFRAR